jgi:hypothetical protein
MEESTEDTDALDAAGGNVCAAAAVGRHRYGDAQAQTAMRTGAVVMRQVGGQHAMQVTVAPDQLPVKTLGPHSAYPPLGVGVRAGSTAGGGQREGEERAAAGFTDGEVRGSRRNVGVRHQLQAGPCRAHPVHRRHGCCDQLVELGQAQRTVDRRQRARLRGPSLLYLGVSAMASR